MMQKLDKISLAFENCDHAEIKMSLLKAIILDTKLTHIAYYDDQVTEYQVCSHVMLNFKKGISKIETTFNENLAERLRLFPDIVSITLHGIDGSEKVYYVPYQGEETNELQTTTLKDNGSITVLIRE